MLFVVCSSMCVVSNRLVAAVCCVLSVMLLFCFFVYVALCSLLVDC